MKPGISTGQRQSRRSATHRHLTTLLPLTNAPQRLPLHLPQTPISPFSSPHTSNPPRALPGLALTTYRNSVPQKCATAACSSGTAPNSVPATGNTTKSRQPTDHVAQRRAGDAASVDKRRGEKVVDGRLFAWRAAEERTWMQVEWYAS